MDLAVVADLDVRVDEGVGPDLDVLAELGIGADRGQGMDIRQDYLIFVRALRVATLLIV